MDEAEAEDMIYQAFTKPGGLWCVLGWISMAML
jgi:hypothetical protein